MDESAFYTIFLLCACLGLLLLLMTQVTGLSKRLKRLEDRLPSPQAVPEAEDESGKAEEKPGGSAFEAFLSEDPARRELTKSEQFAAYRQWRRTRGMNWGERGSC